MAMLNNQIVCLDITGKKNWDIILMCLICNFCNETMALHQEIFGILMEFCGIF